MGGKVEDMRMGRIAQKGTPMHTAAQVLGHKGHVAPLGDQTTDIEAPRGIEIIHHPVVALHSGALLDDSSQMRGDVRTGARLAQIPDDLTWGDDKRGDQGTHPMPDVLVLAFFRLTRCDGLGGVFALQNLPAGLFIAAHDQTALLQEAEGIEV